VSEAAKKILAMIEAVDPADTKTLDEIDALVSVYIDKPQAEYDRAFGYDPKQYTRSRDALKAIRPKGWKVTMLHSVPIDGFQFKMQDRMDTPNGDAKHIESPWHRRFDPCDGYTEELAELHAIIQAVDFERESVL